VVSEAPRSWWLFLRPWLVQVAVPLLAAALLVAGLVAFARWSRGWLRSGSVADVAFADLDCAAPPGMTREKFLEEAQFLVGLPDEIDALDPEASGSVRAALVAHPWVKAVGAVEVRRGVLSAEVSFREPVLFVKSWGCALDAEGHVLPRAADASGLLVMEKGGMKGGAVDEDGVAAAAVAGGLHPHRERLGLVGAVVTVAKGEVVVAGRILWGKPGAEAEKVRLLLEGTTDLRGVTGP